LSNYRAHDVNMSWTGRVRRIVAVNLKNKKNSSFNCQLLELMGKRLKIIERVTTPPWSGSRNCARRARKLCAALTWLPKQERVAS